MTGKIRGRSPHWPLLVLALIGVGLIVVGCEHMARYGIVVEEEILTIGQGSSDHVTVSLIQDNEGIGTIGEYVVKGLPAAPWRRSITCCTSGIAL